jgi:hypothetical protein
VLASRDRDPPRAAASPGAADAWRIDSADACLFLTDLPSITPPKSVAR